MAQGEVRAVNDEEFADFEDCLITNCAVSFGAEYIITRNAVDFAGSIIAVISPEDFCAKFLDEEKNS